MWGVQHADPLVGVDDRLARRWRAQQHSGEVAQGIRIWVRRLGRVAQRLKDVADASAEEDDDVRAWEERHVATSAREEDVVTSTGAGHRGAGV